MIEIRSLGIADYATICDVWSASGVQLQTTGRESFDSFSRQMQTGLQTVLGAIIDGKLAGVSFELLGAGRRLAADLGTGLSAVLFGAVTEGPDELIHWEPTGFITVVMN